MAVNLTAHARLIRAALPHLQASGAGRVVNIASTEAIVTTGGMPAYAATKAGVIGLTKSFAVELGRTGVTVNCICPGPIRTGMTEAIPEEAKQEYARRRVPLRRYGDPEEVAHGTLSLVLPASSFINGAALVVDGGMSIRHTLNRHRSRPRAEPIRRHNTLTATRGHWSQCRPTALPGWGPGVHLQNTVTSR